LIQNINNIFRAELNETTLVKASVLSAFLVIIGRIIDGSLEISR